MKMGVKCATQIVITKATSDRMQMNQLLTKTGSQIIAKKKQTYDERLKKLQLRLDGTEELRKW